jgi:hypothetical protein
MLINASANAYFHFGISLDEKDSCPGRPDDAEVMITKAYRHILELLRSLMRLQAECFPFNSAAIRCQTSAIPNRAPTRM